VTNLCRCATYHRIREASMPQQSDILASPARRGFLKGGAALAGAVHPAAGAGQPHGR
jgi:hypothetical protein